MGTPRKTASFVSSSMDSRLQRVVQTGPLAFEVHTREPVGNYVDVAVVQHADGTQLHDIWIDSKSQPLVQHFISFVLPAGKFEHDVLVTTTRRRLLVSWHELDTLPVTVFRGRKTLVRRPPICTWCVTHL